MIYLTFSIHHFVPCESYSPSEAQASVSASPHESKCHQQEHHKLTDLSKELTVSLPFNNTTKSSPFIPYTTKLLKCPSVSPRDAGSCDPLSPERRVTSPVKAVNSPDEFQADSMTYLFSNLLVFTLLKVFNLKSTRWLHHSQMQLFWRQLLMHRSCESVCCWWANLIFFAALSLSLSCTRGNLHSSWKLKSKQFIRWYLAWASFVSLSFTDDEKSFQSHVWMSKAVCKMCELSPYKVFNFLRKK